MLKVLHTADWHVGRSFAQFKEEDARKLARERLKVIDRILGLAEQYDVDAVLCAGDLFDGEDPGEPWWRGLAESFVRRKTWTRPVVLLPGNHDPLTAQSVYSANHPFRRALPEWVHIVDREGFQLPLPHDAIVYGAPCTTKAGDRDLAMSLPVRGEGDTRVRIGLVHGSTFDMPGYATNFPVSSEATKERGLDYLAIGDHHSFREIPEGALAPIVYPSAPEPTNFKEHDAGYVALVWFTRHGNRPRIQRERVARWIWRDVTVRCLAELRELANDDLLSTVLRLKLDLAISVSELREAESILSSLRGTEATSAQTAAFVCEPSDAWSLVADPGEIDVQGLPDAVREATTLLEEEAKTSDLAKRALVILQRRLHEVRQGVSAIT
jgi:DNA repair exonuclease SbcCD nuclease subunit